MNWFRSKNSEAKQATFLIEDVYTIQNVGIVPTGPVLDGVLEVGMKLNVNGEILNINKIHKRKSETVNAKKGDHVGLLLVGKNFDFQNIILSSGSGKKITFSSDGEIINIIPPKYLKGKSQRLELTEEILNKKEGDFVNWVDVEEKTKKPNIDPILFKNILVQGTLIGNQHKTIEIIKNSVDPEVRSLCASAECFDYINKVQDLGLKEHFILFSLIDEASILCSMNSNRFSNEIKPPSSKNPTFDIEFFPMDTYPLLRICLYWERQKDDQLYLLESTPDITEINLQTFFSNFIKSDTLWVYLNSAEEKIPLIAGIQGHFNQEWIHNCSKELKKAIEHYHKIPEDKRDYQKALNDFQATHPMV